MAKFRTRYEGMPIPPVEANLEYFDAGAIRIAVEFRVLTDELLQAMGRADEAVANDFGPFDDFGVSLHVFAKAEDGERERLRFDCFKDEPHYHYVNWRDGYNDIIFVDPTMTGDVLAWALQLLGSRMPQMLQQAGIANASELVDSAALEGALPRVTEAAYRARFLGDRALIARNAEAAARARAGRL